MSSDDLKSIDLTRTVCPPGTNIEIEGMGSFGADNMSLYDAILSVYVVLSKGRSLLNINTETITILELDEERKFVKARITL